MLRRSFVAALLAALVPLGGCERSSSPPAAGKGVPFLALGDSYTIGEGVPAAERWPVLLAQALQAAGHAVAPPQIIARTGWTTADLQSAIDAAGLKGPYGVVTLLIGVNDQFRGGTADAYREPFRKLLTDAIRLAGGKAASVIVVSIPDWGAMPFAEGRDPAAIGREIDAYNAINREEAVRAGARYVDVTALSREARSKPAWVASDGLHPSGEMYRAWVKALLAEAPGALKAN